MTPEAGTSLYIADEGKLFVRKSDGFIMGDAIDLGSSDNVENYEEKSFSKEELASFWASMPALSHRKQD